MAKDEPKIIKAGIALDNWKLPIFRKLLTEAGYEYEDAGELTHDTSLLRVETTNLLKLQKVIKSCEREAQRSKRR